jgi:hypothetical protein
MSRARRMPAWTCTFRCTFREKEIGTYISAFWAGVGNIVNGITVLILHRVFCDGYGRVYIVIKEVQIVFIDIRCRLWRDSCSCDHTSCRRYGGQRWQGSLCRRRGGWRAAQAVNHRVTIRPLVTGHVNPLWKEGLVMNESNIQVFLDTRFSFQSSIEILAGQPFYYIPPRDGGQTCFLNPFKAARTRRSGSLPLTRRATLPHLSFPIRAPIAGRKL